MYALNRDKWEESIMDYLQAFITGGAICAVCQVIMDLTKVTPARILVSLVTLGVVLTALGLYEPVVEWGGAGATVPLLGFGYSMAVAKGLLGAFTGGVTAAAGGISAAIVFGYLMALLFKSGDKA